MLRRYRFCPPMQLFNQIKEGLPGLVVASFSSESKSSVQKSPVTQRKQDGNVSRDYQSISQHRFFRDLISMIEKDMPVKDSSYDFYSQETVNQFIRPLLQLTDSSLTVKQLNELVQQINPSVLENTVRTEKSQREYHLFYSNQCGTVLDWSVEDFLRRRYESIHLSWEPMDVLARRLGWGDTVMSERDILLYFSMFENYVELALLDHENGEAVAKVIDNPRELARLGGGRSGGGIPPATHLLIRRKPSPSTEPSVTESVRLMGSPSLAPPTKGKKTTRKFSKDSVSGFFNAMESASRSNEGDETARMLKAAEEISATTQAQYPSGRVVKEFSVPKPIGKVDAEVDDRKVQPAFNRYEYDLLCGLFHRRKVEISLLRRRISSKGSSDQVEVLHQRLDAAKKELTAVSEKLKIMRAQKNSQSAYTSADENTEPEALRSSDAQHSEDTSPTILSQDASLASSKNAEAAADEVDVYEECRDESSLEMHDKDSAAALLAACAAKELEDDELEQSGKRYVAYSNAMAQTTTSFIESAEEDFAAMEELDRAEEELLETQSAHKGREEIKYETQVQEVALHSEQQVRSSDLAIEGDLRRKIDAARIQVEEANEKWQALETQMKLALDTQTSRLSFLEAELHRLSSRGKERDISTDLPKNGASVVTLPTSDDAIEAEGADVDGTVSDVLTSPRVANDESDEEIQSAQQGPEDSHAATVNLPTRRAESTYSVSDFMCTPEQYDGLHLAAKRLRREVATLEKEMEEEDAEDDETLMSVLAASRADLEELEECILSVQQHADWAEAADSTRKANEAQRAQLCSPEVRLLQEAIDTHNFNLTLLEKRLHIATQRNVISKLEQGIVQTRREVNQLRREQDRLRKTGNGDTYGLPQSVSMADALGDSDDERSSTKLNKATEDVVPIDDLASNEEVIDAEGTESDEITADSELTTIFSAVDDGNIDFDAEPDCDDAVQLRKHLDVMVRDIQSLQDAIASEGNEGSDEDATASVLCDLRGKLEQLLQIRNDVEARLSSELAADVSHEAPPPPVMKLPLRNSTSELMSPHPSSFGKSKVPQVDVQSGRVRRHVGVSR